jgi:uncharacterized linocin/CFP29 family protein
MATSMENYMAATAAAPRTTNNLGREKLVDWKPETNIWQRIDNAVDCETQRTEIASKFIPLYGPLPSGTRTIASDIVDRPVAGPGVRIPGPLTVDNRDETGLGEIYVEFALSKEQYQKEEELGTAVTLATRAANLLAQVKDLVIFQGGKALKVLNADDRSFKEIVAHKVRESDVGLDNTNQEVSVPLKTVDDGVRKYGENTFAAVAKAYSDLQKAGHYGPYAAVLHSDVYADTYAPLADTLIMPADRIKPLMTAGFYGAGTMPTSTGFVVSVGGNTMDLAVGVNSITAFTQIETGDQYEFRVYERFVLRLKDITAVIRLKFSDQSPGYLS